MHKRVCPECNTAFMPRYGSQVCCGDDCKKLRKQHLDSNRDYSRAARAKRKAERQRKADECEARRIRRARRDLEWESLHTPVEVTQRRGVRVEKRGHCPIAPHFSPLVALHPKRYYYR